jgi:hypothetical protein
MRRRARRPPRSRRRQSRPVGAARSARSADPSRPSEGSSAPASRPRNRVARGSASASRPGPRGRVLGDREGPCRVGELVEPEHFAVHALADPGIALQRDQRRRVERSCPPGSRRRAAPRTEAELSCLGAHVAAPAIVRGLAPDGAVCAGSVTLLGREVCGCRPGRLSVAAIVRGLTPGIGRSGLVADPQHDLAELVAPLHALVGGSGFLEREDLVDHRSGPA